MCYNDFEIIENDSNLAILAKVQIEMKIKY